MYTIYTNYSKVRPASHIYFCINGPNGYRMVFISVGMAQRSPNSWPAVGPQLGKRWAAVGQQLASSWAAVGQPLGSRWAAVGQQLGSSWAAAGQRRYAAPPRRPSKLRGRAPPVCSTTAVTIQASRIGFARAQNYNHRLSAQHVERSSGGEVDSSKSYRNALS